MSDTLICDRCGVSVPAEWAFHEEAGETECPRCWHRCEEKELRDEIKRLRAELADWKRQAIIEAESLDEIEAERDLLRTELADKRPHPTFGEWVTEPRTVALMKRCTAAESERDRYKGALETELRLLNDSLRGTTHYDGCEAQHPKCAAVKRISEALRGDAEAGKSQGHMSQPSEIKDMPGKSLISSCDNTMACPECGEPYLSIPRMGIRHICKKAEDRS